MARAAPFYRTRFWKIRRREALERDGGKCVVPGCTRRADVIDHVVARPADCPTPCAADDLSNLRSLCNQHDWQVKEARRGSPERRGSGFRVMGCDADGWPLDPKRRK